MNKKNTYHTYDSDEGDVYDFYNGSDTDDFYLRAVSEKQINMLDDRIYILWKTVIKPYINDLANRNVLTKINDIDYDKFYKFMIENNEICFELHDAHMYYNSK